MRHPNRTLWIAVFLFLLPAANALAQTPDIKSSAETAPVEAAPAPAPLAPVAYQNPPPPKVPEMSVHQVLEANRYSLYDRHYQKVGDEIRITLNNSGTPYRWTITGAPSNASLDPTAMIFYWKPRTWHVGTHNITFTVSDGINTASKTMVVKVREEWESFFLPGLAATTYIPANNDLLGIFSGISINYVFLAWVHRNEKRGPSHGRLYFKVDILTSSEKEIEDMIYYAFGLDLSFERNPRRPFLIPVFGLEMGGSYTSRLVPVEGCTTSDTETCMEKLGGVFHITPTFGVHLWSDRNFFVSLTGGYTFPIQDYENLRGWRVNLGLNFTMW
ncbi:hypothetical protein KKC22_13555 [Myxococcota bacterium]|nr:hypothetical protein [Myxococcota bacterium]